MTTVSERNSIRYVIIQKKIAGIIFLYLSISLIKNKKKCQSCKFTIINKVTKLGMK